MGNHPGIRGMEAPKPGVDVASASPREPFPTGQEMHFTIHICGDYNHYKRKGIRSALNNGCKRYSMMNRRGMT
jgi:hypothetical protein